MPRGSPLFGLPGWCASFKSSRNCVFFRSTQRTDNLFGMTFREFLTGFLSLSACLLAPGYLVAQAPQFTIQDLGTLPNLPSCNGTSLSQSGNVVGYCTSQLGQNLLLGSQLS